MTIAENGQLDPQSRIRLITLRASGVCHIYTITQATGHTSWSCGGPIEAEGVSRPLSQGSFVLDSKSGEKWKANRARLASSMRPAGAATSHAILVSCGAKGARCYAHLNGERISKVDWGSKLGVVQTVEILEKLGTSLYFFSVFVGSYPS
jgi:syntaxin-binding protein 5